MTEEYCENQGFQTIITLAFVPVFALTGREGKLFHPLAFTKTFAMIGATAIAVTLVPVLCTLLLGGRFHAEDDNPVMRALHWIYWPALRLALAHRAITILLAAALFGGVYFVYALGYNFSVAGWVGFIALFGTAVQTGMVMVIYLNETVERKMTETGRLTRQGLMDAVMEGAVLRLRPKVMTVSTVVAGLLPIMWSVGAGAEVMKPLAAARLERADAAVVLYRDRVRDSALRNVEVLRQFRSGRCADGISQHAGRD